ncbi:DUF3313 family protein [Burkholderia arboris]|uniref:DUF3313 family protein n=1 Tax=Burkholderia arboris TaxID=488730 RepID=UPI0030F2C5DD
MQTMTPDVVRASARPPGSFFLLINETKYSVYYWIPALAGLLKRCSRLLPIVCVLLLGACATPPEVVKSGEAVSYRGLVKSGEHGMAVPPRPADLGRYERVVVESVQATPSVSADVSPDEVQAVRDVLQHSLEAELHKRFAAPASGDAGPSLTVRVRITRVADASPLLNIVTTSLILWPVSTGGLSIEVEALDGRTRRQEALLLLADDGGARDLMGSFQRTGHARALAQRFAAEAADFLAQFGRAPAP